MLVCPEMSAERTAALTKPANDPEETRGAAALGQCHDRLVGEGIDPAQYNYKVAAQDALDLMLALHINRADFTASDLVSAEVFEIVRQAPAAVRSITIDNPAAPGQTELTDPVADLSEAFNRFVARCNDDPTCARGLSRPGREVEGDVQRLPDRARAHRRRPGRSELPRPCPS